MPLFCSIIFLLDTIILTGNVWMFCMSLKFCLEDSTRKFWMWFAAWLPAPISTKVSWAMSGKCIQWQRCRTIFWSSSTCEWSVFILCKLDDTAYCSFNFVKWKLLCLPGHSYVCNVIIAWSTITEYGVSGRFYLFNFIDHYQIWWL